MITLAVVAGARTHEPHMRSAACGSLLLLLTGSLMLSGRLAATRFAATRLAATLTLLVVMPSQSAPVLARTVETSSCVGRYGALSCSSIWGDGGDSYVRMVPAPRSPEEAAALAERDRKWRQRCRPTIIQDRYGVSRYHYAAARCEFGVIRSNQ